MQGRRATACQARYRYPHLSPHLSWFRRGAAVCAPDKRGPETERKGGMEQGDAHRGCKKAVFIDEGQEGHALPGEALAVHVDLEVWGEEVQDG